MYALKINKIQEDLNMKLFKKLLVTLSAALICLAPMLGPSLSARADSSVIYYIKYVESAGDWRFQTGDWVENGYDRDLYYMFLDLKDGDHIVVDSNIPIKLEVNVKLDSLTIVNCPGAVISANSINNFYALNSTVAAINGDINYAAVYDNASVNLNNNVGTIELLSNRNEDLNQTVAVLGTVNHLKASGKSYLHYEFYSFVKNTLFIDKGALKTDDANFSETPASAPTAAPAAPSASGSSSNEYDAVPKTGDIRFNPFYLIGIAAVCFLGSYELKKRY